MISFPTPADENPELAQALGRLAQCSAALESGMADTLQKLLPISTPMADAIFEGMSISGSLRILQRVAALPDVPITDEARARLASLLTRIGEQAEHRNRLLHGQMLFGKEEQGERTVYLRSGRDASRAWRVTVKEIEQLVESGSALYAELMLLQLRPAYDAVAFEKAWRQFSIRPYPALPGK